MPVGPEIHGGHSKGAPLFLARVPKVGYRFLTATPPHSDQPPPLAVNWSEIAGYSPAKGIFRRIAQPGAAVCCPI